MNASPYCLHCLLRRLVLAWLCLAAAMAAAPAELRVWTLTETRHVLRGDPPGSTLEVKLSAARHEWRSFQILARADAAVPGLRLEAGELKGPGNAVLGTNHARLFRQHQLFLETGTSRNTAFKPDWYPDPLIPLVHPTPGQTLAEARIKAVPLDLPAGQTQGFWVDLYVPQEAAPGQYRGVYRLTNGQGINQAIPVSLAVWDFELPLVPSFATEFGSPMGSLRDFYRQKAKTGEITAAPNWPAIEAQCAQLLADHDLNAVPPSEDLRPLAQPEGPYRIPSERINALRQFVDRYHVNAVQTPHPSSAVKDPELERDKLRAWLAAFDRAAKELERPQVLFYTYLRDEPNTLEDYRYVQKWGRAVREAKSAVKVLVVEQTWTERGMGGADSAWGDLYGAVDIWCPLFSLHRQESAARRQALGEIVWTYTALCQGQPTPWWHIDFPLLNYRVPSWIAWHYRMKGLLYWGGLSYWRRVDDPWRQAPYFVDNGNFQQGRKGIVFNGEGSLVYPARTVGYDGIAATVRLKALRDGIQDYEYLAMLDRLGKASEAERIIAPLVQSFFKWENDPAAYETARARLADLIVSARRAGPATR